MADLIRDFFDANRIIILFIYGQVFFVLGLVIALQSWRHSRLALARSLKWMAAFGFLHGFHEWGDVFIPFQAQYLSELFIDLLFGLQVVLLAISFACLFQFGIETLRPLPDRLLPLRYLPGLALAIWIFIAFGPTLSNARNAVEWYTVNNILARYSMGFPGALLAAYGLRRQAQSLIAPLDMPHIWRTLQIAGLALAGYSFVTGLVVPQAPFFPANWLNSAQLERLTLIPVQVYRSLFGLILTLVMLRVLEVFRLELDRQLISMEEAQMLAGERERIGRELHDGTLQTIYAAGLLLKAYEKDLNKEGGPPKILGRIQQTVTMLDHAVAEIRAYIGALRDRSNSLSLATGLQDLASAGHLGSLVDVELILNLPDHKTMNSTRINHLLAIANEGLSNVARHSQATKAYLSATAFDNRLQLEIKDNGRGLPTDYVVGYGLRNMRDRARILGGEMLLDTKSGQGTTVLN